MTAARAEMLEAGRSEIPPFDAFESVTVTFGVRTQGGTLPLPANPRGLGSTAPRLHYLDRLPGAVPAKPYSAVVAFAEGKARFGRST